MDEVLGEVQRRRDDDHAEEEEDEGVCALSVTTSTSVPYQQKLDLLNMNFSVGVRM